MDEDEVFDVVANTEVTPSPTLLVEGRAFPNGYAIEVIDRLAAETETYYLVWKTLDQDDDWTPAAAVSQFLFQVLHLDSVLQRLGDRNLVLVWDCLNLDCSDIHAINKAELRENGYWDGTADDDAVE